jgi:hypothetical protein
MLAPLRDATRDQILYAAHDLADRLRVAGRDAVGFSIIPAMAWP